MTYEIPNEILETLQEEEIDRELVATELIKRLKETNTCLPKYKITSDQFDFDGQMVIHCGDNRQWELVLWSDGILEATTYYKGSIFDLSSQHDVKRVLLNPQLIMDSLEELILNFCEQISFDTQTEITFEDLVYDPNGDFGAGCWIDFEEEC